jgi:predicted DNA-binding transcriptional regulator AlpA
MPEQLIDIKDLAGILKVPAKTIRNKLSDGTWPIQPVRIGRSLRWRPSDVEAFVGGDKKSGTKKLPPELVNPTRG